MRSLADVIRYDDEGEPYVTVEDADAMATDFHRLLHRVESERQILEHPTTWTLPG